MKFQHPLVCAIALLTVSLAACGSGGDHVGTARRARRGSVDPQDAMASVPVHPQGGVPLSGGDRQIWISDFTKLAAYDRDARRWGAAEVPWPTDHLDGMVLHAGGDGALGAVLLCDVACGSPDVGSPPVRLVPFRATIDGDGTVTVEEVGDRSDTVENLGNYALVSATDAAIDVQLIDADGGGSITHITPDGSRTAPYTADLKLVCRSGDGWVGIERVDATEADAVPWSPLPRGWNPNEHNAQRFVAGADPASMESQELPAEARPVLANWTGLAMACIPDGLALVGLHQAWEHTKGTWHSSTSTMRDGVGSESAGLMEPLGDGTLYGRPPTAALLRSADGSWSSVGNDPVLTRLGNQTLRYARPAPEPVVTEPEKDQDAPGRGN